MNSPCQAIAAAKQSPAYFLLRDSQSPNGPGNRTWTDDAANTTYSNGTAHLTESWIMEETAGPLFNSIPIMAMTIAIDIGPVMSQNSLQSLMALFFNIWFKR